jgi:hypothetical protein
VARRILVVAVALEVVVTVFHRNLTLLVEVGKKKISLFLMVAL